MELTEQLEPLSLVFQEHEQIAGFETAIALSERG
jgi:hypothetical protein